MRVSVVILTGSVLAGYHLLFTTLRYAWRR